MKNLSLKSFAKINFGLNIVSKRTDGFHNIETIFYPIELHDLLTFEANEVFSFSSDHPDLKHESSNLIVKAHSMLERLVGKSLPVKITLTKNIPMGAGLGGGSSNAAVTLLALNQFFELHLERAQLSPLAESLGSDVPFFLNPVPSFASSRGERLFPITIAIHKPLLILNPGIHISTKWAYENIIPKAPSFYLNSLSSQKDFSLPELRDKVVNDFEEVAFTAHPQLKELKESLYEMGAEFSLMSGSGSTLFAIFPNRLTAEKTFNHFSKTYFTYLQ